MRIENIVWVVIIDNIERIPRIFALGDGIKLFNLDIRDVVVKTRLNVQLLQVHS